MQKCSPLLKMSYFKKHNRILKSQKAFTLVEVTVAIMILGIITFSVLVIMSNCIAATKEMQVQTQAFELARENMERILASEYVTEMTEFGQHPNNPDIEWSTVVEHFYEPITNKMWVQAVCRATYIDGDNETQTIELTHWITNLSEAMTRAVEKQNEKMQDYMELLNDDTDHLMEQAAIRTYLEDVNLDVKGYDNLLNTFFSETKKFIMSLKDFQPELVVEFRDQQKQEEDYWLTDNGFSQPEYIAWRSDPVNREKIENIQTDILSGAVGGISYSALTGSSGMSPLDPSSINPTSQTPDNKKPNTNDTDSPQPANDNQNQSGLTPELRQKIKDVLGLTDAQIDAMFGQ